MVSFRSNLSPVEIKTFLKTIADYTDDVLIIYCYKNSTPCPQCGHLQLCRSGALSLYSSSLDKVTHTIIACLHCGYKTISVELTCERL
ncbi:MAG: hypothetical protein DRG58_01260 [Deltaproteobacteria bacterium]|nr:MAG: hypothetical protein DRG58_01260 [Deltaproteobacteria bacterium]